MDIIVTISKDTFPYIWSPVLGTSAGKDWYGTQHKVAVTGGTQISVKIDLTKLNIIKFDKSIKSV